MNSFSLQLDIILNNEEKIHLYYFPADISSGSGNITGLQ